MTPVEQPQPVSDRTGRTSPDRRRTFGLIATVLAAVVGVTLAAASHNNKWWSDNLMGPDSSNFVPVDQIKKTNVGQLEVAWFYPYATQGFNPIVVDNVMYVLGRGSSLIALDATTGKELWIHEGLAGITSRGVNFWQSADGKDKRILFSINSFLQAIDATTGKSIATFGEGGVVDLRKGLARAETSGARVQSNSPGKVWKNLLILGSAPGEAFVNPPGDIRAYDVITGEKKWQFHTVPWPGEFGYETWSKDSYQVSGGANAWAGLSVDAALGMVFAATGSASFDFYGANRIGDNLFANCVLALDARTGKRIWHFQGVRHDTWDLDFPAAPSLVTVMRDGRKVDAVAQITKTGYVFVLDRKTGKPLFPVKYRSAPASQLEGEKLSPLQPTR